MSSLPTNSASNDANLPDVPISFGPTTIKHPVDTTEENQTELGNNSDNSSGGIMSIGNNSFGFNFDNEEALGGRNSNNDDDNNSDGPKSDSTHFSTTFNTKMAATMTDESRMVTGLSSLTNSSSANLSTNDQTASLNNDKTNTTITLPSKVTNRSTGELSFYSDSPTEENRKRKTPQDVRADSSGPLSVRTSQTRTDMYDCGIDDSGGYSDNESATTNQHDCGDEFSKATGGRKKKHLEGNKREERNQREKERSFRISKQITELRELLSNGGVVVPKGTKSSVLTEAANYIRMLQQHQYRSEIDRHQLIQQMQLIGQGAHGPQAAQAIRHFAAQNGVWSLGNFGGVPPKSAMNFTQADSAKSSVSPDAAKSGEPSDSNAFQQTKVELSEYRFIFNSCGVGMAVASMGGAFVDCNQLFCQLSNFSKQEVCGMTIFNMTARSDLQRAFDQISQLISPPIDDIAQSTDGSERQPVMFRGSLNSRDDLGLCVSLVKGEDGVSKCFCVTLVKNPTSPFENSQPVAASFESILSTSSSDVAKDVVPKSAHNNASPAFTSG